MANLRELNSTNPFWDWVSEIERQNRASNNSNHNGESSSQRAGSASNEEAHNSEKDKRPDQDVPDWDAPPPPPPPNFDGPPDPPSPPPHSPPPHHHHSHHHNGPRGRGGHHRGSFGGHHRGGHQGNPWQQGFGGPDFAGWGASTSPFGAGFPFGRRHGGQESSRGRQAPWEAVFGQGGFDMTKLAEMLKNFGIDTAAFTRQQQDDDKNFTPAVDVFDTPQAYFVHLSLAGAKKQDLDVSWDAENFQVIVGGIIHRPGDEEFLKTIAVEERDIGVFERKIKLGTKKDPVGIDADGIAAKMEDGVLMIKVPKHVEEEFFEIKKVDIE